MPNAPVKVAPMQNIKKLYDLSQPLFHNCPGWPDYDPTTVSVDYRIALHGFNAETLRMNTHTGTHLDVPRHFFEDGKTVDQVPLETFMGPAVFCDLRHKPADTPITAGDLAPFLSRFTPGDLVILNTGFGKKRGFTDEYLHKWVYLSGDGAKLLVKAGVKGVGIDALSIGGWGGPEKGRPCHEALLGAGVFVMEELFIPDELMDGKKRLVSAFPLLLRECGGAPARVVAYEME